jgi:hypothetical protein
MVKPSNEIAVKKTAATPPVDDSVREFVFPGSTRRISINRKYVTFAVESKKPGQTIIGLGTQSKACPVEALYDDVYAWWRKKPLPQQQDERKSAALTKGDIGQHPHSPDQTGNANALSSNCAPNTIAKGPVLQVKRCLPGTLTLGGKARTVSQAEKTQQ